MPNPIRLRILKDTDGWYIVQLWEGFWTPLEYCVTYIGARLFIWGYLRRSTRAQEVVYEVEVD